MDYTDLTRRLADRAKSERAIQANNQAVATALRGQRLLFEQGARSDAISYAMRLCLEHENCAKHDAALAADWDEAAAAIAALEAEVARVSAIAGIALDGWQSWVDDQLQGTSHYDETIAEVNATRAALTAS